jgi:RNA polymerase sigma-70 factor, ECF subfamily
MVEARPPAPHRGGRRELQNCMAREADGRAHLGLNRIESRDRDDHRPRPEGCSAPLLAAAEGSRAADFAVQHRPFPADGRNIPGRSASVKAGAPHNGRRAFAPYNRASARAPMTRDPSGPDIRGKRQTAGTVRPPVLDGHILATYQEISAFLAEVERRAFKQAMFAVRDDDAALDIVQDAMLKLTEKYSEKPLAELPLLFQRILQNTIHDHFRRRKVRSTWTTLLSALGQGDEKDEDFDPLETLPAKSGSNALAGPAEQLEQAQVMTAIEDALSRLPARQREAFLLRYWEELDVAETAAAMGCSEGSVKTHCSRAVHALAETLKAKGVSL